MDLYVWLIWFPYEEGKLEFIQEQENLQDNWDGPTIIGDFNLGLIQKRRAMGLLIKSGLIFLAMD